MILNKRHNIRLLGKGSVTCKNYIDVWELFGDNTLYHKTLKNILRHQWYFLTLVYNLFLHLTELFSPLAFYWLEDWKRAALFTHSPSSLCFWPFPQKQRESGHNWTFSFLPPIKKSIRVVARLWQQQEGTSRSGDDHCFFPPATACFHLSLFAAMFTCVLFVWDD